MSSLALPNHERLKPAAFWCGVIAVSLGVIFHLPSFIDCATMDYQMVGMPMDPLMLVGMALIVGGMVLAGYGLLPPGAMRAAPEIATTAGGSFEWKDDMRLTRAHWQIMLVVAMALVIDTMKPATLGFVVPGTAKEYGLPRSEVALLPFVALTGTTLGSFIWGVVSDRMGRRAAILWAGIMFVGTSICGFMPSFTWNLVMCFLMGLSAGGMLPIAFILLAETIPTKHRGWFLVLLGGVSLIGGYLAASGSATLLEPIFGWRIMWFLGLPTGLLLIFLNRYMPESARFLVRRGRIEEARAVMARFGADLRESDASQRETREVVAAPDARGLLLRPPLIATTIALNLSGVAWGLVNFGLLLWLPAELRARGFGVAASNALLAQSAIWALPTAALTAWLYGNWSSKKTLVLLSAVAVVGLTALTLLGSGVPGLGSDPVVPIAILMFGSAGLIAVLLPYSAENYPLRIRGTATGLVAGSSKLGGIAAQCIGMASAVPPLTIAAPVLALPVLVSAFMVGVGGVETRGRGLEEVDALYS